MADEETPDLQAEYDYASAEQGQSDTALPGDNNELRGMVMEPASREHYAREINRDMVLANLNENEKELIIHIGNLQRYIEKIDHDIGNSADMRDLYRFFNSMMLYRVNVSRGVGAKTLDALCEPRERKEITRKAENSQPPKSAKKMGLF